MAVFAIADLHLSLHASTDKSMEIFGNRWRGYVEKLEKNWRAVVKETDTVILPGDISWALTPEEAVEDFLFLESLPGKKLVGKGNHDFYWQTMRKMESFRASHALSSIQFLYNNAYLAENIIVCGSRGWFYDPAVENIPKGTDFEKITAREAVRLSLSFAEAKRIKAQNPGAEIIPFMHFPVVWGEKVSEGIFKVLSENGVKRCYFGHIHGAYEAPPSFDYAGIRFTLIAADYLQFVPKLVKADTEA